MKTIVLLFLLIVATAQAAPVIDRYYVADNRLSLRILWDVDADAYVESSADGGSTWTIASWLGPMEAGTVIVMSYEMRGTSQMFRLKQGPPIF